MLSVTLCYIANFKRSLISLQQGETEENKYTIMFS